MNYLTRQEQLLFIDIEEEISPEFETLALSTIVELPDLEKSGGSSSTCASSENNTRLAAVNWIIKEKSIFFLFKIPPTTCSVSSATIKVLDGFIFFCYLEIYGTIN